MLVSEIIESINVHPDQWTFTHEKCPIFIAACPCAWRDNGQGNTEVYSKETRWSHSDQKHVSRYQKYAPEVAVLRHVKGTTLVDFTPHDDKGWRIVDPKYVKVGWWAGRKLAKAIVELRKKKLTDSLMVTE